MIIIADSSPLIVLINIRHIDILPALFGDVTIPPQVAAELAQSNRPGDARAFIANAPSWLRVLSPVTNTPIPPLHDGETAAINLALELHADLLLIDEVRGRKVAADRHIPLTGTIGVLERAAEKNLLDLAEAFEQIKKTDFWISQALIDQSLKRFQQRQRNNEQRKDDDTPQK